MLRESLETILSGAELSREQARALLAEMLDNGASPELGSALLVALRMRGESSAELCGFAELMRERCTPVEVRPGPDLIDTCGTGGDGSGSFNISTATAFVAAGMGLRVAKHGNRSVSSRCGSADVLEELGVNVLLDSRGMAECIEHCGVGFLYAPALHPAMASLAPLRRALGVRTCFNMLGPLSNPARASRQLIGCFSEDCARRIAGALSMLGGSRAFVVAGRDGLDEISLSAATLLIEVNGNDIRSRELQPADFGLAGIEKCALLGGERSENADIIRRLLAGEAGPAREIVLANAAACAVLGGLCDKLPEGVAIAAEAIDSGRAKAALQALVNLSNSLEVAA
ncbi:anthranilate phosphoribosyltransferase [bacterium]|nr:anthranilate phosphoribosyltransferase [bacterium]